MRIAREQFIIGGALLGLIALSWAWLIGPGQQMSAMGMFGMDMPGMETPELSTQLVALSVLMWAVMMSGMMLPSATPMILLFSAVQRRGGRTLTGLLRTASFLAGYVVVWGGFSVVAALAQVWLSYAGALSPSLALGNRIVAAAVLIAAAAYELSPLKDRCLRYCRGPFAFIVQHWRAGAAGALRMGLAHGAYCVGCCWALMLLLFVAGVMNLFAVAALGALVLAQKLLPGGRALTVLTAVALAGWSVALLASFASAS